ncbi:MAG: helix-hairpin-helix domain-containing protein, partial [Leptospiraceae bacterium]|nr:helix-hairpin-helix domain-containing protein [Leptospiraceae bacterium]
CLDSEGNFLFNSTIYPHPPQNEIEKSRAQILELAKKFKTEAIAIGNGTASRETESFFKGINFPSAVEIFMVNEAGASIYSASKIAREEFPDQDVTVRGAVSIGRRLLDPLAELVKIEPKSIGVGQYQHDVDQSLLHSRLDQVVESCVNLVGVNLNTASKHLLAYVSGVGPALAESIVNFRKEHGQFKSRKQLLKVPRLGEKAFEQCAGFLRIPNSENPLDNSAVHPEAYPIVEKMAKDLKTDIATLLKDPSLQKKIEVKQYLTDEIGLPTLQDIVKELAKPGLDPRQKAKSFSFDDSIKTIDDLKEGLVIPGIVNNLTNFGAFVNIGIKESGLLHISQISNQFIKSPSDILQLNQQVKVKVVSIDKDRKRVQLTTKFD